MYRAARPSSATELTRAAGSPASDSAESATTVAAAAVAAPAAARRHGKGAAACRVAGCMEALHQPQNKAHRICAAHRAAPSITAQGGPLRFCQQCNVLHPLFEFSGARRSCQKSLRRRRERRQRFRQLQQQPQGTPSRSSGSSGDDGETAAAGGGSKCSPVSEQLLGRNMQRRLDSAAQDSVSWQSTVAEWADQLPVTASVALPAAPAAPESAQSATAPCPTVTSWQLDGWEHTPVSSHHVTAHTPLPSVAQPPTGLLPVRQPATEQQAVFLGAEPTSAPEQHQRLPQWQPAPPQWRQPSHYQLPPTPLPPPQGHPPLWQQQGGQVQVVQAMLQAAELGIAPQGQWDTRSSLPQAMQLAVAGPAAMPVTLAQLQQRPASMAHAQQWVDVAPAVPPALLASQRSAPLSQPDHLLVMQQGGPAPLLPAGLGYAAPGEQQQRLPHSRSCPSHLAALQLAEDMIPSESELLQLSCELGVL